MVPLQKWFDGVYLVGQFNWLRTGCWLLAHGGEAAVLEMPPGGPSEPSPADLVAAAVGQLGVSVRHLLCTHAHLDHFSRATLRRMRAAFPSAVCYFQRGFRSRVGDLPGVRYFEQTTRLDLAGEPLFLVPAPKHSSTDTIVIFRGSACTGDWELGTIRSVHDWTRIWGVPRQTKLESIERMERFQAEWNYHIHRIYSVHANDRREGVDFTQLMADTRTDRPL